jgi:hypothetical protein
VSWNDVSKGLALYALLAALAVVGISQTRLDWTQVKNAPNGGAGSALEPGPGIDISGGTISVSGAAAQQLWGSASLDFPSIPTGTCRDLTLPLPGAQPGDTLAAGWPATLPAGLFGMMFVPAPSVVAVRACNLSGAAVDLPPLAFSARILRSF